MGVVLSGLLTGLYSFLLMTALVLGSPFWLARMLRSGRYRAGLGQRLGRVPTALRAAVAGLQVVWVHAVSVGEVLAATRLVTELEAALGEGWVIVVSTTTATGQALAQDRFRATKEGSPAPGQVFYYPLDLAWAVRAYLRALRPKMLVLMESELWPRMLVECGRAGIPVAVVNARVSDRSYARGVRVRAFWCWVLRRVDLFLAQSLEDGRRLVAMGVRAETVRVVGNLKYDVRPSDENPMMKRVALVTSKCRLVIAGSTLEGEEAAILAAWPEIHKASPDAVLLLSPRHPQRFAEVVTLVKQSGYGFLQCSQLASATEQVIGGTILILDTVGDLAAMYSLAAVAFIGGSLVPKGGHNPLEPAQFGVPVVMGPSYENFRDVVDRMQAADGIRIVQDSHELQTELIELLTDREKANAMGERGRLVSEAQQGATARAVEALVSLVRR
jgi:3-deoxy-D-manno-octulosonic-acid transferase